METSEPNNGAVVAPQVPVITRAQDESALLQQGESIMAVEYPDLDALKMQHNDIRFEQMQQTADIIREGLKETHTLRGDIKDSRFETIGAVEAVGDRIHDAVVDSNRNISDRVENNADRVHLAVQDANFNLSSRVENAQDRNAKEIADFRSNVAERFHTLTRDTADLRAQVTGVGMQIRDSANYTTLAMEKNALQGMLDGQRNTQFLAEKISNDGEKTRSLINDLKYHDLNRALVERNAELMEERHWGRHWWSHGLQNQNAAQFASLQSQVQAIGSQLASTSQSLVNLGVMTGSSQSSSTNNIR